jgi:hypothetical protein
VRSAAITCSLQLSFVDRNKSIECNSVAVEQVLTESIEHNAELASTSDFFLQFSFNDFRYPLCTNSKHVVVFASHPRFVSDNHIKQRVDSLENQSSDLELSEASSCANDFEVLVKYSASPSFVAGILLSDVARSDAGGVQDKLSVFIQFGSVLTCDFTYVQSFL